MDPNGPNRMHLNFNSAQPGGIGGYSTDRTYQASNDRIYPTTPSTFPQPIFQNPRGQVNSDYVGAQLQSPQAGGYAGNGGGGYFFNNQYQPQYTQQQGQYSNQYHQQNLPPPLAYTQRQATYVNEPLARQFSNQNLGSNQRQASPFGRHPSPNQRPRTGGATNQQTYDPNTRLLAPLVPGTATSASTAVACDPPERDVEKHSSNVGKKVSALHLVVDAFFKNNINRARERNQRSRELEAFCSSPEHTEKQMKDEMQKSWTSENQFLRRLRSNQGPSQYVTRKVIGKGAFGEVKLVTRKSDHQIFALKSLVKAEMFKKDQLAHVRAERDLLSTANSQWVVRLYTTFQDATFLYMLMEYLPGGDLMTSLIKYEIFSEDVTRFYIAEILLAIEAVHGLGYIHRDIKPDNILMDAEGHVKLTDFGLSTGFAKQHEASYYQQLLKGFSNKNRDNRQSVSLDQINLTVSNRREVNTWRQSRRRMAYSTVGTPDYIAPEIFGGHGYTYSCDWWSLGAIMFECMIGWPPFCAEEPHDTYRKIVNWKDTLLFPEDVVLNARAENLIRRLLCDAPIRLGHEGGAHGAEEIKAHPFFDGVQWDKLRDIRAPFKPNLSSALDVSYFPTDEIDQTDHSAGWRAQTQALVEEHGAEIELPFIGYTYNRFD